MAKMVTITRADVSVYHSDTAGTGAVSVSFTLSVNGNPVNLAAYTEEDINLTTNQKNTIDQIITAVRTAATARLKADMAALT